MMIRKCTTCAYQQLYPTVNRTVPRGTMPFLMTTAMDIGEKITKGQAHMHTCTCTSPHTNTPHTDYLQCQLALYQP